MQQYPNLGRSSEADHDAHCKSHLCCRCQTRAWDAYVGHERLCSMCAKCCRNCGRRPASHLDGLPNGLCAPCRGECQRCGRRLSDAEMEAERAECASCSHPLTRPGRDPVAFVLGRMPRPLMDAMHGRVPADVYQTVLAELGRRSPQQLTDRVERRWYLRWAHALRERDEDNRPRWSADEIALQLVAPAACPVADCEDGVIVHSDRVCVHCQQPEYRFVAGTAGTSSVHTRSAALAAMRQAVRSSPSWTGATARGRTSEARPADPAAMDRALEHARARLADPDTPRLTEPPPPPEPGVVDSVILAARAERAAEEQDPVRLAAVKRARADRARRQQRGR